MKGRVTGALFIVLVLVVGYFCFDGMYFGWVFAFALLMSCAEILIITNFHQLLMEPLACQPTGAWAFILFAVLWDLFALLLISKEELLLVVAACWMTDVGAFTAGKLFGKHKVYALHAISPNKTVEGFIGGIIVSILVGIAAMFILGFEFTAPKIIFIILCGPVAEIGDLLGSASKRQLGVKDSGDVLGSYPVMKWIEAPIRGHGGYLDRTDSLCFCILLYALLNVWP